MTKQVLVTVKGVQFLENDSEEAVELVTTGNYHCRDNNKYIKYEEVFEDIADTTSNLITIKEDILEVCKKGAINTRMTFQKDTKTQASYKTPYGTIVLRITTKSLDIQENKDNLDIKIDYSLEANNEHLSDCSLSIQVKNISRN